MDVYAIHSNKSPSNLMYWSVDDDGVIDTSGLLLDSYPFELIPVEVPTGIEALNPQLSTLNSQGVYDLQGRHVAHPSKGFYIVNGKKILIP